MFPKFSHTIEVFMRAYEGEQLTRTVSIELDRKAVNEEKRVELFVQF